MQPSAMWITAHLTVTLMLGCSEEGKAVLYIAANIIRVNYPISTETNHRFLTHEQRASIFSKYHFQLAITKWVYEDIQLLTKSTKHLAELGP